MSHLARITLFRPSIKPLGVFLQPLGVMVDLSDVNYAGAVVRFVNGRCHFRDTFNCQRIFLYQIKKVKFAYEPTVAHQAEAYPGFRA